MVRKIIASCAVAVMLLTAFCGAASAATYEAYEGTISTTYLTFAKDILPNLSLDDHYVFFRADQYDYKLIVGELVYTNGWFSNLSDVTVYSFSSGSGYNSYYSYSVTTVSDVEVNPSDKIVYSDLGNFPQLEERGQRYEVLNTILFGIFLLCAFIRGIFFPRFRR